MRPSRVRSVLFDRPVSVQIGTALAVLALVAVGLTVLAVQRFASLHDQQVGMYDRSVAPLEDLARFQREAQMEQDGYLSLAMATDPAARQSLETSLSAQRQTIAAELTTYEAVAPSPAHVQRLAAAVSSYDSVIDQQYLPAVAAGGTTTLDGVVDGPLSSASRQLADQLATTVHDQATLASELEKSGSSDEHSSVLLSWSALLAGILLAVGVGVVVVRQIVRTVRSVGRVVRGLAQGDLTVEADVDSRDELGRMAAELRTAQAQLRGVISAVAGSAEAVAGASQELSASSAQIASAAEETSAQSAIVASAAEEVSSSVQTVAAGAEQMGASIKEISSNANDAARVASQAVQTAEEANATVTRLGTSSTQIDEVVRVITAIAEQTNLLALNATIEAARAGEAGKGFAVVATEVKELAQETARATDDIGARVRALQTDSADAVGAIARITDIIGSISDYQLTIASAVEEQTATTNEMARSVNEAAAGAGQIAANVTGVSAAADASTQALSQAQLAVDELARMASDLRSRVQHFVV